MRAVEELGSLILSRGVKHCLVLSEQGCGNRARDALCGIAKSLNSAGVTAEVLHVAATDGGRRPGPKAASTAAGVARRVRAQAVVGVGAGGILDLAKAAAITAAWSPHEDNTSGRCYTDSAMLRGGAAPLRRLGEGFFTKSDRSLRTFLVPTTATVAAASKRVLLQDLEAGGSLVPLANVESGAQQCRVPIPALIEIVGDTKLVSHQSAAATMAAATHALGTFVDAALASAGRPGTPVPRLWRLLWWDMTAGLASTVAAMKDPMAKEDALRAALCAGSAASTVDASTHRGLSVVHTLACVVAGSCPDLPFPAVVAALLPPVLRVWGVHSSPEEFAALTSVCEGILRRRLSSANELASWVEERCASAGVPRPALAPWGDPDHMAVALALRADATPALQHSSAPAWVRDQAILAFIFREVFSSGR